jgi:hypothetical protein
MDTFDETISDTESGDNETVIEDEQPENSIPELYEIANDVYERQRNQ